jgi:N-acetylglucosaminyl-diphospho-decaprenol L-rhamnosyltransferase
MTQSRLTVIIVTHNSAEVITQALESIDTAFPVMVVDNASTDNTCALVIAACPRATLIQSNENLGFGRANNLALAQVTTEFALLLNPDAVLREDTCTQLLHAADTYKEAAIIAPVLLGGDGVPQDNFKGSLFARGVHGLPPLPEGDVCAGYVSGAVMLMRMAQMQALGFFDSAIFMFYEDDDICMRIKASGYTVLVAARAVAVHRSGSSSPQSTRYIFRKNWHMGWSRLYIEQKYRGRKQAWQLAALQFLLYSSKTMGYALLLKKKKAVKSLARLYASLAFMARS